MFAGPGCRHPSLHHLLRGAGAGQAGQVRDVGAGGRPGRHARLLRDGGARGGGGTQSRRTRTRTRGGATAARPAPPQSRPWAQT